jgi:16S rRNA (adenine1518-N6/adenine1519-N6)-dimethyltransferase
MKIIKKKSLGQNFLKDEEVLDKIILAGELSDEDNVLEIGPGEGALTKKLLEKVSKVVAIEKDDRLKDENNSLQKICRKSGLLQNKIKLYFEDILKVKLPDILRENHFDRGEYKVIANIPYYITGKILRLLFQQKPLPKIVVLLVQKEVAERIVAQNNRQSILSLSVQYYGLVEIIDYVSKEAFDPTPKVDSAILRIRPQVDVEFNREKEKKFFQLIKVGFSSPRKKLLKNLSNGLQVDKNKLENIFRKMDLDLNVRAENLKIKEWKRLIEELDI